MELFRSRQKRKSNIKPKEILFWAFSFVENLVYVLVEVRWNNFSNWYFTCFFDWFIDALVMYFVCLWWSDYIQCLLLFQGRKNILQRGLLQVGKTLCEKSFLGLSTPVKQKSIRDSCRRDFVGCNQNLVNCQSLVKQILKTKWPIGVFSFVI